MEKEPIPVSKGWLWITLIVAITGGLTTFFISLDKTDPMTTSKVATWLTITMIGAGISLICATANWWIHR